MLKTLFTEFPFVLSLVHLNLYCFYLQPKSERESERGIGVPDQDPVSLNCSTPINPFTHSFHSLLAHSSPSSSFPALNLPHHFHSQSIVGHQPPFIHPHLRSSERVGGETFPVHFLINCCTQLPTNWQNGPLSILIRRTAVVDAATTTDPAMNRRWLIFMALFAVRWPDDCLLAAKWRMAGEEEKKWIHIEITF